MVEPITKKFKLDPSLSSEDALLNAVNSILPSEDIPHDDTGSQEHGDLEVNIHDVESTENGTSSPLLYVKSDQDIGETHEKSSDVQSVDSLNRPASRNSDEFQKEESSGSGNDVSALGQSDPHSNTPEVNIPSGVGKTCAIVAAHYNNLEEKGLEERDKSRIVHLRNFNNWTKSMLIDEYLTKVKDKSHGSPLRVLDMGCGKGGDLFKWRKGNITHLVCADIASTSVEQCKERYQDMAQRAQNERHYNRIFSAEFIVANCTKERLRNQYKDVTIELDLVSCQFAFHYCFESLPQAESMLQNASECLRPGGYFIGTCPNANTIISRLRKAGGKKFGNEIYSVEFETELADDVPPPLFGAKYNFHMEGVVDCPEFLVHFPTFERLAAKYNLELVACEPFASFYKRMQKTGRGLLGKMQALETYPPFPEQQLTGPPDEYKFAESYIKETGSRRIGTMSISEWEAATLYLVFAFKKIKKK